MAYDKRGRPPLPTGQKKQQVTMLLNPDVVAYFKQGGKDWQTRVNEALRKAAGLKKSRIKPVLLKPTWRHLSSPLADFVQKVNGVRLFG